MLKFGSKSDINVSYKCTVRLLEDTEIVECEFQRAGERHGVASQPTKVSFRANKNKWITETVDGASHQTSLAEKSYVWKYQFSRERFFESPKEGVCKNENE
uniref:Uncharacterized protein n=1 Tax=Timema monikensis TaxID=170555 RepID=A0A7R9HKM7_9NEOP|nr:unnamed protein product [Timema monikensis]